MLTRRGFLSAILAAGVAPYVARDSGVLMPVRALWTPRGLLQITGTITRMDGATYVVSFDAVPADRMVMATLASDRLLHWMSKNGERCASGVIDVPHALLPGDNVRFTIPDA